MRKTYIASLYKPKGIFSAWFEKNEYSDVSVLLVKNRINAIKKLVKTFRGENIVIACGCENEKIFSDRKKIYRGYEVKTVLPAVESLCRKTAEKFGLKIPFAEIYIEASPDVACDIVKEIKPLSRIFTIVSEEPPATHIYDELYFKHGTVIRHITGHCNNLTQESVILRCNKDFCGFDFGIPVINFTEGGEEKELTVNAFDACISDERIDEYMKLWGGRGGLHLYSLLDEIPAKNARIDINKKADEIFLLDTSGI